MKLRSLAAAVSTILIAGSAAAALPNYNALADAQPVSLATGKARVAALAQGATLRIQWDDRFGVPNFLWAGSKAPATVAAAKISLTDEVAAKNFVAAYAPLYALDSGDVASAVVSDVHDNGRGAVVVKLKQRIGGVDVFREELNVIMDRDRELIALSGHISAVPRSNRVVATSLKASAFLLSPANAIASAIHDATEKPFEIESLRLAGQAEGGYQLYDGAGEQPVRVKRVYFHLPDRYEPAYYLEVETGGDATTSPDMYGYVISAIDGRLLFRNNLVADQAAPTAFSYRVWAGANDLLPFPGPQGYDGTPNPTASLDGYQPLFLTAQNLITVAHGPISTKDPWLPASATQSTGNNVDAYADLAQPDGFSSNDFRAESTASLAFDRAFDVSKSPATSPDQQMAAITQLFYVNNFLHDWFYDSGFNERAGNAQADNYGRGGIANDVMRAEAQDYGGRNNANMQTPSDGGRPRMQMYVWDGQGARTLRVTSPTSAARLYLSGTANFGPQSFEVSGDVVAVTPADGCTAITSGNAAGKIVFVDRGGAPGCGFIQKSLNTKNAGAIGMIVGNVPTSAGAETVVTMACSATGTCSAAEMGYPPAMHVALADANVFRAALANATMRITMARQPNVDRDGTIDNQIIAHEWMHYMSNRLIADSSGLTSNQARGMGEGWSDFGALLMSVRPDDTRFASNTTFNGAYAMAIYVATGGTNGPQLNNGTYWGIRRVPYSTDMTKNPLTLKHVTAGVQVSGATLRYGAAGDLNAQVHATGEVWATMLWEAYASLLRDTLGSSARLTFAEAQQRMKDYLVASLRMTPADPTFIEARDAVLAAAFARDKVDYERFWTAFAKRGAGINAVAPDRYSIYNKTASEDFNAGGALTVASVTFDDNITSCVRNGSLEAGETGAMRIAFRNTGAKRMESTTVTVSTNDTTLAFPNGASAAVPASNPGDTVTAVVIASLPAGVVSVLKPDVTIVVSDPQIVVPSGHKTVHFARLNAVAEPKSSLMDDVESSSSAWTVGGTGATQWHRIAVSPRDHRWFAPEPDSQVDTYLISPPMMVAPAGAFSFSFRHRFAFDHFFNIGVVGYVDGGVIEISTDNGATWKDIGDKIDPATVMYGPGPILTNNGSAIEGRRAFQGVSPGFNPDSPSLLPFSLTRVNLGVAYAGQRVRIRFRSVTATDHSYAPRLGWEIDDIEFTNITNLPFNAMTGDRGICVVAPSTTTLTSSTTTANGGVPVTFTATVNAALAVAGSVDFFDNGAILGTARVENGIARLSTSTLPQGTHVVTAAFNGGKNFATSSSGSVTVQVLGGGGRRRTVGK